MLYTMSDQLRDEGYAKGRVDERAEVLEVLGVSPEEYQKRLEEKKEAEKQDE